MRSVTCHPTAEWVYCQVRRTIPNISLGTVYRNLKELSLAGRLNTVETQSGRLHYDGDTRPHAHFVCKCCEGISDIEADTAWLEGLRARGFVVDEQKTVVYGTCAQCAGQASNAEDIG